MSKMKKSFFEGECDSDLNYQNWENSRYVYPSSQDGFLDEKQHLT